MRWIPHTPTWTMRLRSWRFLPIALVSIGLGWGNTLLLAPPLLDTNTVNGSIARARVNDVTFNDFSMNIDATLTSATDNKKRQILTNQHDIIVTTAGCDYTIQPGDLLTFVLQLDTIRSLGNPDGFDYRQYMLDNGVRYSTHLNIDDIHKSGKEYTLLIRCTQYRHSLQRAIYASSLSEPAQNFVIATLLGNSRFISSETRAQWAAAGLSHVLALSGLHIGIIMVIVWFFLFPLDYLGLRRVRLVITIAVMALYATFTGLSPSVVRATVMMVVVLLGLIFYRKSISLNTLATAALVILIFSPSSLKSIGFQLSFTTVAAFLLFFEPVPGERKKTNKYLGYLISLVASSLVAMLSTLMLTAWYFSSISLTSVIANVIILPVFPVVMACSAAFVVMCAMRVYLEPLNKLIDWQYSIIERVARITGEEIPGHIEGLYVTGWDVAIYYVALLLILLWWRKRELKWLTCALALVAVIIAHGAWTRAVVSTSGVVVFNNYSSTQIFSFANGHGRLWVPDAVPDVDAFKQYNTRFLAHYGIESIDTVGTTMEHDVVHGMKIVCATGGKWKNVDSLSTKINTDLLIVTRKYHGNIARRISIYNPQTIILSGDIYKGDLQALVDDCNSMGLHYYNISNNGAWIKMGY